MKLINLVFLFGTLVILTSCISGKKQNTIFKPVLESEWWEVTGNPDLGEYTNPGQQPVDFGVWQAADGTWQLWSCIRHTNCGGNTRLFHGWEAENLTDTLFLKVDVLQT